MIENQAPFVIIKGFLDWFYDVYLEDNPGEPTAPRGNLIQQYYAWQREQHSPQERPDMAPQYTFEQIAKPIPIHGYVTNTDEYGVARDGV